MSKNAVFVIKVACCLVMYLFPSKIQSRIVVRPVWTSWAHIVSLVVIKSSPLPVRSDSMRKLRTEFILLKGLVIFTNANRSL